METVALGMAFPYIRHTNGRPSISKEKGMLTIHYNLFSPEVFTWDAKGI